MSALGNDLAKIRDTFAEMSRVALERLDKITAEVSEALPQKADPKPIAEPGDMFKLRDTAGGYALVTEADDMSVTSGGFRFDRDQIEDVYTKAEQEANGALIQVMAPDGRRTQSAAYRAVNEDTGETFAILDECLDEEGQFWPFDSAVVSALGIFQLVPDRAIVPGDCVRSAATKRVWIAQTSDTVGLSLVAPEDPAFIAPPVIKEEPHDWQPTTNTLAAWRCTKCNSRGFSPHPLPKTGCTPAPPVIKEPEPAQCDAMHPGTKGRCKLSSGHDDVHDLEPDTAPVIKEPEPELNVAGEDDLCRCTGYDSDCNHSEPDVAPEPKKWSKWHEDDCTTDHEISVSCADAAPSDRQVAPSLGASIPEAWDLITAGDGRHCIKNRPGEWLDYTNGGIRTDAEILALGPVRRAVVVTLPDEAVKVDTDGLIPVGYIPDRVTPYWARTYGTELLAAAFRAEEQRNV